MKYLLATLLSFAALPSAAHHAGMTAPFQAADHTSTWLVIAAMSVVVLAMGVRHALQGPQG